VTAIGVDPLGRVMENPPELQFKIAVGKTLAMFISYAPFFLIC
jgi:hypothetical protein